MAVMRFKWIDDWLDERLTANTWAAVVGDSLSNVSPHKTPPRHHRRPSILLESRTSHSSSTTRHATCRGHDTCIWAASNTQRWGQFRWVATQRGVRRGEGSYVGGWEGELWVEVTLASVWCEQVEGRP